MTTADADEIADLWRDTQAQLAAVLTTIEWAEDEIAQATKRHPAEADVLYHAFTILTPPPSMPATEFVHRGHARELLERLAADQDTRPATDAELCVICSETSLRAPLTSAGAGLYFRAWARAFPSVPGPADADLPYYERLHGAAIDDLERILRNKAAVPGRRLGAITCDGYHHGELLTCRFNRPTPPTQLTLPT